MEFVHEVTAYLENNPDVCKICSALAHEKIDVRPCR